MRFPEPKKLPKEKPKADETPKAEEQPSQETTSVPPRQTKTYRPKKTGRVSFSLFKPKAVSRPKVESQPKAPPVSSPPPRAEAPRPEQPVAVSVPRKIELATPYPETWRHSRVSPRAEARSVPAVPPQADNGESLPRPETGSSPAALPQADSPEIPPRPASSKRGINPGKRVRAVEIAGKNAPPPKIPIRYRLRPDRALTRRAAWDISSILSLVINAVLLGALLVMALQVQKLKNTVNGLMGGLYDNFVRMDKSTIIYNMPVPSIDIPLDFNLPVNQPETNVVLTQNVTITNARVTINAGILTITNAPATVVLPAGTTLPVSLSMNVPVKTTVTTNLLVPVNIPLSQANPPLPDASLHGAFLGLQDTIGPLFCLLNPEAKDYTGSPLCSHGLYVSRSPVP